jgi:hypothetical protein
MAVITCNGSALVPKTVTEDKALDWTEYIYDVFVYLDSDLEDGEQEEGCPKAEEEEDSEDENNPRNEYPDEEKKENGSEDEDEEYGYGGDDSGDELYFHDQWEDPEASALRHAFARNRIDSRSSSVSSSSETSCEGKYRSRLRDTEEGGDDDDEDL